MIRQRHVPQSPTSMRRPRSRRPGGWRMAQNARIVNPESLTAARLRAGLSRDELAARAATVGHHWLSAHQPDDERGPLREDLHAYVELAARRAARATRRPSLSALVRPGARHDRASTGGRALALPGDFMTLPGRESPAEPAVVPNRHRDARARGASPGLAGGVGSGLSAGARHTGRRAWCPAGAGAPCSS